MIWFTSDLHFGHEKILKYHPNRGSSLDEMHGRLIDNWNSCVGKKDEVWVIGDFYLGRNDDAEGWFRCLNGRKNLVQGNHDSRTVLRLPWHSVHQIKNWRQKPHRAVLCHYPMMTWDHAHHGVWMLHGHSHGHLKGPITTRFDVGIDCHPEFRPFSLDEIIEIMADRKYKPVDAHVPEN